MGGERERERERGEREREREREAISNRIFSTANHERNAQRAKQEEGEKVRTKAKDRN